MEYIIHLIVLCLIYSLLVSGFNISFGMGRLLNFSHVASYGVGAYASAILSVDYSWPFWACLLASAIVCALFSLSLGAVSLRLTRDYFAIGSLAFSFLISALFINWKELTRGVLGIPGIPRPIFFGGFFKDNIDFMVGLACFTVVMLFLLYKITNSRLGLLLKAQGEQAHAVEAMGVSLFKVRNAAFIVSSFIAGIAGSFFAFYLMYIDPSSFAIHEMVFVLTIVVMGKPGSFWGGLLATWFLVLLPEPLRHVNLDPGILGPMRQFLYAVILFSTVYVRKEALFPVKRAV
jgi:branched-chain amino acid transport system permease protein